MVSASILATLYGAEDAISKYLEGLKSNKKDSRGSTPERPGRAYSTEALPGLFIPNRENQDQIWTDR